NDRTIAFGTVFKVELDGHESSVLTIPIQAHVRASEVIVEIENKDSPPLKIDAMEATRYPVSVAFHSGAAGHWQLFTGNPAAPAPAYDVAALSDELRNASALAAKAAELVPNPSFDKGAALPETGDTGAAIDMKGWAFRTPVTTTQRGVMQLELRLEALAHASAGFSDLRLVQAGHQLPYLLQPVTTTRDIDISFTQAPDPKRPNVSRWELTLPLKGMPVTALKATSSTPLFSRHFQLMEPVRDSHGNHSLSTIGSKAWSQKPGAGSPLTMLLSLRATSGTLFLETDNGDNSPVKLDKITVSYPVVQLLFKTVDAAPIQLYYGNPGALTPRYDLSLMEKELRTAPPLNAVLGAEEQLKPIAEASSEESQGSPWLWAALALVVGGLLWIVAKLLPQNEA
ncbi:MAG: hypothetical protein JWO89_1147, partial [Verrucomicrobiaceae bacterium]|nr:hypothetical protein [Verrucomicrobiaceae bacterium]